MDKTKMIITYYKSGEVGAKEFEGSEKDLKRFKDSMCKEGYCILLETECS